MESRNISIIQQNTAGFPTRLTLLRNYLGVNKETLKDTILIFNDCRTTPNKLLSIRGFKFLYAHKSGNDKYAGGTCLGIPSTWKATQFHEGDECVMALICTKNGHILKIMAYYSRPPIPLRKELFEKFRNYKFNNNDIQSYIVGDLNSPHTALGSTYTNEKGRKLLKIMEDCDLYRAHGNETTYISRIHGTPNLLDYCLCDSIGLSHIRDWRILENQGSDHFPTITTISLSAPTRIVTKERVNWEKFKMELGSYEIRHDLGTMAGIDDELERLSGEISRCLELATTKKAFRTKGDVILGKDTENELKHKRRLEKKRNLYPRSSNERTMFRNLYNRTCKHLSKLIKRDEILHEQNIVRKINVEKDSKRKWQLIDKLTNYKNTQGVDSMIKDSNGVLTAKAEKIANIQLERLLKTHNFPADPSFDETFKNHVHDTIEDKRHVFEPIQQPGGIGREQGDDVFQAFYTDETKLGSLIDGLKEGSAPGIDKITHSIIKNFPEKTITALIMIFNSCLEIGYFPNYWKAAKIKLVLKRDKPPTDPKSYRPISLLSTLGKLFEKVILSGLEGELRKIGFKNDIQSGFRKGRSAQENFVRLTDNVLDGFKERKCTIGIFLDVEGAFDKVWREGLMFKLYKLGLSNKTVRIVSSFVNERKIAVSEGEFLTDDHVTEAGTPQGAILSPMLFALYTADLPLASREVHFSQYADDLALWSVDKTPRKCAMKLQKELNNISNWCRKWRTKLAPNKTQTILFSNRPTIRGQEPRLTLEGVELSYSDAITFLGCTMDSKLNWQKHVDNVIKRTENKIWLVNRLARKVRDGNFQTVFELFNSFVLSAFDYGAPAFICLKNKLWNKISQVQHRAVKLFLGLPSFISNKRALNVGMQEPIRDTISRRAISRLAQMSKTSPLFADVIWGKRDILRGGFFSSPLDKLLEEFDPEEMSNCLLCTAAHPHSCVKNVPSMIF